MSTIYLFFLCFFPLPAFSSHGTPAGLSEHKLQQEAACDSQSVPSCTVPLVVLCVRRQLFNTGYLTGPLPAYLPTLDQLTYL